MDVEETGEILELAQIGLDDFVREHGLLPNIIVIDVQGAELEVLAGGMETLSNASIVEVEVSREPIYEGGAAFKDVDRLLVSSGFSRVTAVPAHGDVLYVRLGIFNEGQINDIHAAAKRIGKQEKYDRFRRYLKRPDKILRKLLRKLSR